MVKKSLTVKHKILLLAGVILLSAFLLLISLSGAGGKTASADPADFFAGGDGSALFPYEIATEEHLMNFQSLMSSDYADYGGKSYILTNDITLTQSLGQIGAAGSPFTGNFNGRYFSIYGFELSVAGDAGLFYSVESGGVIEKLNLLPRDNGDGTFTGGITSSGGGAGAFAARLNGGTISNCVNTLPVSGSTNVGGIVGIFAAGNLNKCMNAGTVEGDSYIGGICGTANRLIEYCFNSGAVTGVSGGIGGIAGALDSGSIIYSYNSGDVYASSASSYAGGIIGEITQTTGNMAIVAYSYNIGAVESGGGHSGAFIGYSAYEGTAVEYCYNNLEKAQLGFIGGGETANYRYVKSLYTAQMVGSVAFDEANMSDLSGGNYVLSGGRSEVADFAPQLKIFATFSPMEFENPEAGALIKKYSLESVMLRLFGIEAGNYNEWGTAQNPYLINSVSHFNTLRIQVNTEKHSYAGKTFRLEAGLQIQTGAEDYVPIGLYYGTGDARNRIFAGTFDGNGQTLNSDALDFSAAAYGGGIFGYVGAQGSIKRLDAAAATFRGINNAGLIAAYCEGSIEKCRAAANVSGAVNVGGIVGQFASGNSVSISDCVFEGSVSGNAVGTRGGITGWRTGSGTIKNCWYIPSAGAAQTNDFGSVLYADIYGGVDGSVNFFETDPKKAVAFNVMPDAGFEYAFRNLQNNNFVFNGGTADPSVRYPMYVTGYAGEAAVWYLRFTKNVTIGTVENGTAEGAGKYYVGESVRFRITPNQGYRLILNTALYSYTSDGETITCNWTMGTAEYEFTAECRLFGHEANAVTYTFEGNKSVVTNVAPDGTVSTDAVSFPYNGVKREFNFSPSMVGNFSFEPLYYRVAADGREPGEARNATTYVFVIKLKEEVAGNALYVGKKEIFFEITPKKLEIDISAFSDDYYTKKQYDKGHTDSIAVRAADITNIVGEDYIVLTVTRRFLSSGIADANVSGNKTVQFTSFVVSGSASSNYTPPDDLINDGTGQDIPAVITNRSATVRVSSAVLTKQYDGSQPSISVVTIDGELSGDNLNVSQWLFTLVEGTDTGTGCVGKYRIGLVPGGITGATSNYDIGIEEAYFTITPRLISKITFSGISGLYYDNAKDWAKNITGVYNAQPSGFKNAALEFFYNGAPVTECKDAGYYIVRATITDTNYQLTAEQSESFTISRVLPQPLTVSGLPSSEFYSAYGIRIITSGGSGFGEISFEILNGKATVVSGANGTYLYPHGSGSITLRAKEAQSQNYLEHYSAPVSVLIKKSVIYAYLSDITVYYGDTPSAEITYRDGLGALVDKAGISGLIEPTVALGGGTLDANENGYPVSLNDDALSDGYIIDVSRSSATLTVLRKSVRVDAVSASKVYGTPDPVLGYSLTVNGIVLNGSLGRENGENAGKYLITQGNLTDALNPNYIISFIPAYFEITKQELRVKILSAVKIYGDPDPAFEFSIEQNDLKNGDTENILTGNITRTAGESCKVYPLRESNISAGINYSVRFTDRGSLTILKATPFIFTQCAASAITYGDLLGDSLISGVFSALVNKIPVTVPGKLSWTDGMLRPQVINSGLTLYKAEFIPDDGENFNGAEFELTVSVSPRNSQIAFIGATTFVYDGTNKKLMKAEAKNLVAGDTVNVTLTYSAEYLINAATYTVTASISNPNYVLAGSSTVTVTVSKAELTVTADNLTITDGDSFIPTVTYSGFKGSDNAASLDKIPSVKRENTSLVPYGGESVNYSFRYIKGTLTVLPNEIAGDNITVTGHGLSGSVEVGVSILDINAPQFTELKGSLQNGIDEIDKTKMLGSYAAVNFSENVNGSFTYEIKMKIADGADIVLVYSDGSVSVLKDYTYSDGVIKFESGRIMGIGELKDKTVWASVKKPLIWAGIAAGGLFIIGCVIYLFASKTKKNKHRRSYYKN